MTPKLNENNDRIQRIIMSHLIAIVAVVENDNEASRECKETVIDLKMSLDATLNALTEQSE